MRFVWIGAGLGTVATVLLAAGVLVVRWVFGRRPRRVGRTLLWVTAVAAPFWLFVGVPLGLGWMASRLPGTRGDERAWAGPRLDAEGAWILQTRASLSAEANGAPADPALLAAATERAVEFVAADGTRLRAFWVPAPAEPPRADVVLVHGLFRGGLELEPVARMFRSLGCAVLMLELRNHGGSGRAPATYGLREAQDVVAAAEWIARQRGSDRQRPPLVLFGVSLGTAAVALAAPRVADLDGLVLDAPMDDARSTAERMLARGPRPGRRGFRLLQPWRFLVLEALELWSSFELADVVPIEALRHLDPKVAALVIGAGEDDRMPPATVRAVFEALPAPAARKTLWIRAGSQHGNVWLDDPDGYRRRLDALLALL